MDEIINNNSNTLVSGTSKNDHISNWGDNVTISSGAGNDRVVNGGNNVTILGGAGDDTLETVYCENLIISGGSGGDSIYTNAFNITITGGVGNDFINIDSADGTISGGDGNDSINVSRGGNLTISGGAGRDTVSNQFGDHVTIFGGSGNDLISLSSFAKNNVIKYASGDDNDTILGFNSNDTLHITKGSYSTTKSGSDVIVKVGKSKIILKDALTYSYDKISIKNSKGKISTYNDWKVWKGSIEYNTAGDVTLAGSKNADTIENYAENVLITSGNGNDSIYNDYYGKNVTINAGAGNDSIMNYGGNDVTITGGKGKDLISLSGYESNNVIQYATGDGKDTIYGFNSDDTLQITKGSYKVSTKNNDVIVKIGSGSITLKDAVGTEISIKNSSGKVTTKTYGSSSSQTAELFAENNFATADNLSEIVAEKSVGEIEISKSEKISQENLIAYTTK